MANRLLTVQIAFTKIQAHHQIGFVVRVITTKYLLNILANVLNVWEYKRYLFALVMLRHGGGFFYAIAAFVAGSSKSLPP